jgi:cytoskeleton protein RodZ
VFEIGTTLREARVRRNLTLQQVEEDTKIRVKYVQAMENEDFDIMPGPTYVKGFLRTYAEYLGLDPDVIIGEYRSREPRGTQRVHEEPFGGVSTLGKPRSHRGRNTIVFVAVVCLLVLGVIWFLGRNGSPEDQLPTKPSDLGLTSTSPTASPSPIPTLSPAPVKDIVKITAKNGDCWIEVRRDGPNGVKLYSGTIKDGERRKFRGERIWMSLGNPIAVRLVADGKKVKLESDVGPWPVEIVKGKVKQGTDTTQGTTQ